MKLEYEPLCDGWREVDGKWNRTTPRDDLSISEAMHKETNTNLGSFMAS